MGFPCCRDKTPLVEASTSTTIGLLGSDWMRSGADVNASLSRRKACEALGVQDRDLGLALKSNHTFRNCSFM